MNTLRRSTTLPLATLGLLVACAGNGPTPPPQGITVSGRVQDRVAEPISGATVLLGKSPVTSSAGGDFSGNDFAAAELTDPPEQSISGAITVPASYTLNVRQFYIGFGHLGLSWEEKNALSNAFTYTVPDLSGVAFAVAAE